MRNDTKDAIFFIVTFLTALAFILYGGPWALAGAYKNNDKAWQYFYPKEPK